jgi:hypothetical protein
LVERAASSGYTQTVLGDDVPSVPLALAVERLGGRVDLAKFDCEGAEWELFADEKPWQHIGAVAMEFHLADEMPRDAGTRALSTLGFTIDALHGIDHASGIVLASR